LADFNRSLPGFRTRPWNRWLKSWSAEHRAALPKPIRSEPIDARRSNRPCCDTDDKKREAFRLDGRRKKI
jgi:hypothetical protein